MLYLLEEHHMKRLGIFCIILCAVYCIAPSALRSEVKIPAKAAITVYWRYVPVTMNPFEIKAPFDNSGTVKAAVSPFGGGGITGKQVISVINKKKTGRAVVRYRALFLKNQEDPSGKPSMSTIVVRNDDSFYDTYVINTKDEKLAIYVDVVVEK
jgi:hypothetical protein